MYGENGKGEQDTHPRIGHLTSRHLPEKETFGQVASGGKAAAQQRMP
jgi:hypothetical protein